MRARVVAQVNSFWALLSFACLLLLWVLNVTGAGLYVIVLHVVPQLLQCSTSS